MHCKKEVEERVLSIASKRVTIVEEFGLDIQSNYESESTTKVVT